MFSDLFPRPVITPPCGTIGCNCACMCGAKQAGALATANRLGWSEKQTPPRTAFACGGNYKPALESSASPELIKSRAAAV